MRQQLTSWARRAHARRGYDPRVIEKVHELDRALRGRAGLALALVALLAVGARTAYKAGLRRDETRPTRTDVFTFLEGADAVVSETNPVGLREREHGYPYVYPPLPA